MFGINPAKLAKEEVLKIDLDHNGVPDALQILDEAEEGCDWLIDFIKGFDKDEAAAVLKALNSFRKPDNQASAAEINEAAAKIVLLPGAVGKAKVVLESFEAELRKK